jgi:hypothetical protein
VERTGEGELSLSFRRGKGAAWVPQGVWKEGQGGPELQGRHPQTFPLTDVCMKPPPQYSTADDDNSGTVKQGDPNRRDQAKWNCCPLKARNLEAASFLFRLCWIPSPTPLCKYTTSFPPSSFLTVSPSAALNLYSSLLSLPPPLFRCVLY